MPLYFIEKRLIMEYEEAKATIVAGLEKKIKIQVQILF